MKFVLDRDQQFADAEQAHDSDHEADALHQFIDTHGEPHAAGDGVDPDRGKGKADRERYQGLDRRVAAHADEACKGQKVNREIFRRAERQRDLRDPGGRQRDENDTGERAEGRRTERGRQRRGRPAVARHRIAVESGRDRRGLAGDIEQDRRDRAAEQRAPIHAGKQDDRRHRLHAERQRQQQRDAVGRAEPGQHADQNAEQHADQHQKYVIA